MPATMLNATYISIKNSTYLLAQILPYNILYGKFLRILNMSRTDMNLWI